MNKVKGVILCGSSNIGLVSPHLPSPSLLAEIKNGYTILDKQIFQFKCSNVPEVYIITNNECSGALSEKMDKYNGIKVEVIEEKENKGSVGAIRTATSLLEGDLIIRNSDVVSDLNMDKFTSYSKSNKYPVTLYVTKLPSPYGIVQMDSEQIIGFEEKPVLSDYINAGVYYFKDDLEIPEVYTKGKLELTLFPELAKSMKLGFFKEDVFWRSFKTTRDLEVIRQEYLYKTDKAWGYEKLLVHTDKYMTKELFIREGYSTSYHLHDQKDETMYVNSGRGYIKFEDDIKYFSRNDKFRIEPKTPHSIVALENTLLYEFSTSHIDDTSRIDDYYPRDTER